MIKSPMKYKGYTIIFLILAGVFLTFYSTNILIKIISLLVAFIFGFAGLTSFNRALEERLQ